MDNVLRARIALFGLVIWAYAIALPLPLLLGMKTDLAGLAIPGLLQVISVLAASYLCTRFGALKLRATVETHFLGVLLVLPEALSIYSAAHLNMPWADLQLAAMDRALGWHWQRVIPWIDSNALLSKCLVYAYYSFGFQLLLLPIILSFSGNAARAYQMTIMFAVICFISGFISIWYPAVGTYSFYNFDPATLKNLDPGTPTVFMDQLVGVRGDPSFVFSLDRMKGIVTFPSVHAASAVLCAWAAWGVKPIRYPALALNLLMGFSAAIVSNHYMADVIGGIGIAGFTMSLVLLVVRSGHGLSFRRLTPSVGDT